VIRVATINHVRLARLSPSFADECEHGHPKPPPGHRFGADTEPVLDPYTRRSNICAGCHTTMATVTGECLC
jgi:hypothetical protein